MNVNDFVKRYVSGEITREQLEQVYKDVRYSNAMLDILMHAADHKKSQNYVVCDVCGCSVHIKNGELIYNAEINMSFFECFVCMREEGSI